MKYLYKFYWDCGRMGELEGLFIAEDDVLKNSIGKNVYFGEVLGKHSEIYGVIGVHDFIHIPIPREAIEIIGSAFGMQSDSKYVTISGYNPLDCLEDEE